eukprot:m51a1_g630 hypothetical protein (92) ;mRNA; f:147343-147806
MSSFLGYVAAHRFSDAFEVTKKILEYEPQNDVILEYRSLLAERMEQIEERRKEDAAAAKEQASLKAARKIARGGVSSSESEASTSESEDDS